MKTALKSMDSFEMYGLSHIYGLLWPGFNPYEGRAEERVQGLD